MSSRIKLHRCKAARAGCQSLRQVAQKSVLMQCKNGLKEGAKAERWCSVAAGDDMAILVDKSTKVICQGITGSQGT
ncbi:hypothetical protein MXD81_20620, partial [Microbacteriaceae bacterium K1510]|nr:hypothetical protein [Microbacteriaceae bacterium K1510]